MTIRISVEDFIFERQESIEDECKNCPHKTNCNNQCNKTREIYNPNLR